MKKVIGIVMFVVLIGLMSACDSVGNEKSDYISEADLDEREEMILTTVADQSFVFDYNNTSYEEVSVWIEKYESGEMVNDELGYKTTDIDEQGSIIFATASDEEPHEKETFYLGVGDENGTSSSTPSDDAALTAENMSILSGSCTEEIAIDKDETVLATIAYTNDEQGVSAHANNYDENTENNLEELEEYDVVYLFKIAFDDKKHSCGESSDKD